MVRKTGTLHEETVVATTAVSINPTISFTRSIVDNK